MFGSLLPLEAASVVKIEDFFTFIAVVSMCAGVLYLVYRYITPGEPDELEFASTIFILTIAIGLLVSIIKHAPAISFGLFGAMSIVRFRSQIKRPQRMIFIFMAAAIGVCCGAGEYLTTVLGTAVLSVLTLISFKFVPVRTKGKNKVAKGADSQGAAPLALAAPRVWGVDFLPAILADGRRYRVLVIVDEASGEALAAIPETTFSGSRVAGELDRLIVERGKPNTIVSETWPQFASQSILDWKQANAIDWQWLDQVPTTHRAVVAVASVLRDQCLSGPAYATLLMARAGLDARCQQHNKELVTGAEGAPRVGADQAASPRLAVSTLSPASRAPLLERAEPPGPITVDAQHATG